MSDNYIWAESYSACRLQLSFSSLIKLLTVTGVCVGVACVPLILILGLDPVKVAEAGGWGTVGPMVVVLLPVIGAINGLLSGVLAYPVYRLVCEYTKGQTYTGIVVGLHQRGETTTKGT